METKLSPHEAEKALELAEQAAEQMRRALGLSSAWVFLVIWGIIWTLGFLGDQFLPQKTAGLAWTVLDVVGLVLSFGIGFYYGRRRHLLGKAGIQIALYWLVWLVYGSLMIWVARPTSPDKVGLLILLFVMFSYVVMGIWLRSAFFAWVGVAITIYTMAGYYLLPPYFNLVMASAGLALVASGVYLRLRWG